MKLAQNARRNINRLTVVAAGIITAASSASYSSLQCVSVYVCVYSQPDRRYLIYRKYSKQTRIAKSNFKNIQQNLSLKCDEIIDVFLFSLRRQTKRQEEEERYNRNIRAQNT